MRMLEALGGLLLAVVILWGAIGLARWVNKAQSALARGANKEEIEPCPQTDQTSEAKSAAPTTNQKDVAS